MTGPCLCILCGRDDHASEDCPWPRRAFVAFLAAVLLASCGPQTSTPAPRARPAFVTAL